MTTAPRSRFLLPLLASMLLPIIGCSAQPMTLNQELVAVSVAGAIGAGAGAVFASSANQSYPASIGIGAGGMAGAVFLYEEIKREAAVENMPPPPPVDSGPASPLKPNQ